MLSIFETYIGRLIIKDSSDILNNKVETINVSIIDEDIYIDVKCIMTYISKDAKYIEKYLKNFDKTLYKCLLKICNRDIFTENISLNIINLKRYEIFNSIKYKGNVNYDKYYINYEKESINNDYLDIIPNDIMSSIISYLNLFNCVKINKIYNLNDDIFKNIILYNYCSHYKTLDLIRNVFKLNWYKIYYIYFDLIDVYINSNKIFEHVYDKIRYDGTSLICNYIFANMYPKLYEILINLLFSKNNIESFLQDNHPGVLTYQDLLLKLYNKDKSILSSLDKLYSHVYKESPDLDPLFDEIFNILGDYPEIPTETFIYHNKYLFSEYSKWLYSQNGTYRLDLIILKDLSLLDYFNEKGVFTDMDPSFIYDKINKTYIYYKRRYNLNSEYTDQLLKFFKKNIKGFSKCECLKVMYF